MVRASFSGGRWISCEARARVLVGLALVGCAWTASAFAAPSPEAEAAFVAARTGAPVAEREFRDRLSDGAEGPAMVALPAGAFTMGSPEDDPARFSDEGPQRDVTIGYPLAVGKHEVTWAEWERCVAGGGCDGTGPDEEGGDNGWGKGARPVIFVSLDDARAYAAWLSRETGRSYRLLSEAEWEYAARAVTAPGVSAPWSFGDDESVVDSHAWHSENADGRTQPVGQKLANAFGLHDMHGNVSERVEDCYASSYSAGQPSDGRAFTGGACATRVFRGGSWDDAPEDLRSALRSGAAPSHRMDDVGFRVARTN